MCAKERIAILKQFKSNPQLLIDSDNEMCDACRHRPHFHRHAKQTTPSTDESINDERASPTHKVTKAFAGCIVCPDDVWLEALWGPTKNESFSICFWSTGPRNNYNNLIWISHSLLFGMICLSVWSGASIQSVLHCTKSCIRFELFVLDDQRDLLVWWNSSVY